MSCRNLLGLPERRSTLPDGLETESEIHCNDPGGGVWFGRRAEQSPLTQIVKSVMGTKWERKQWRRESTSLLMNSPPKVSFLT